MDFILQLNIVDWVIIGVLALSSFISFMRGFAREAFSLIVWVAAFIIARMFSFSLANLLVGSIDNEQLRLGVAFAGLFITTLIIGALINNLIGDLIKMTGLSGTDRMLGSLFGVARGMVVVLIILAVLARTNLNQQPVWQGSLLVPQFLQMEEWSKNVAQEILKKITSVG